MMTIMNIFLFTASIAGVTFASGEAVSSFTSIRAMEKVFLRSEKAHQSSMAAITRSITSPEQALEVLKKKNKTSPALLQVADEAFTKRKLRRQPKGYSGIDGARRMLNNMIFESNTKYDNEIAKCTEYYSKQCGLMQVSRGEIAGANYIAANSRMHILDAASSIGRCEEEIPKRKLTLGNHNKKCKRELSKMTGRLKMILADIEVMTSILKMTDCNKKLLLQVGLMKCTDQCTKASFITFEHDGLRKQFGHLQSALSHQLSHDVMSDLFAGVSEIRAMEFSTNATNITKMAKAPGPRTEVPANPCNDPNMGAPSSATKRAAKCSLSGNPQCFKLQERFLLIQSGIQDERDDLLEEIAKMEGFCKETKDTLETQISDDAATLGSAQTKLAAATEDEASAQETARQTAKQFDGMNTDLLSTMKTCTTNYINFETEICALKKIRGELFKMQGGGAKKSFFVDCSVTKWDVEECTKKCGGGNQKMIRGVITHPNGGAACLPLTAMSSCNQDPCPVDCKLNPWSEYSKCSAECGGGVQQRLRDVSQAMKFGGKPCGETSETRACNPQACEKDCVLSRWTKFSECSKDCDGGTQKRTKWVKEKAQGEGHCPGQWEKVRLEYKKCNMITCPTIPHVPVMKCEKKLDIVMLLDGSGSLGQKGWDAEMEAAKNFLSGFQGENAKAKIAVLLFSGPKTWAGVKKCMGANKDKVDPEKCGLTTVTHFSDNIKNVRQRVLGLDWPRGSTLTSLALATAKAELSLGRKNAKSVVIVFTDGRPMSYRKTKVAAIDLRKSARLIWVPISSRAPLAFIKQVATRRWQENVVLAATYKKLASPAVVNHLIANICPQKKMLAAEKMMAGELPMLD